MNYQFDKEQISQHIVKYGVDIRPIILLKQDKTELQEYCNWLIEQFPEVFETLLVGPGQLLVQKNFLLSNKQRIEMPTFVLTGRGPLFAFPQRVYFNESHDLDISEKDKIFHSALNELRNKFADRKVVHVGVVHEFVFDTAGIDSLKIVTSSFKSDIWKEKVKNLHILLETPTEDKNINLEISPTRLRTMTKSSENIRGQNAGFGIIVNVDINNRHIKDNLTNSEVYEILTFANEYVPEELIKFLNSER
jgi:hypothetical protein